MKLRVDLDDESFLLELSPDGEYALLDGSDRTGKASVEQIEPGIYSVILNHRSVLVYLAAHSKGFEVQTDSSRHFISFADPRDASGSRNKASADRPIEIRAQMPGKIIKLLVEQGAPVTAGQGLIVVEAMKMQNEVKCPRDGTLVRIFAVEGATVSAGDPLLIVE